MKTIIKNGMRLLVVVLSFFTLLSCEKSFDADGFETSGEVAISSFIVNGVVADINGATGQITVTLPFGSTVTAAVPEITLPEGATINPGLGTLIDFSEPVYFRVINGNIYKDYVAVVEVLNPILSFKVNDLDATINNTNKTISLTMPEGTDLTALSPVIELSEGVAITPASGTAIDFTNPVVYTITSGSLSVAYTVNIGTPAVGVSVAFLGTAATRGGIVDLDEKAAADWLFDNFASVTYLSFAEVSEGTALSSFDVIWWHHDAASNLPAIAISNPVISALQNYRNAGGNLLLTTFASQYVDALAIVPPGKGPNNVFGDFGTNGFVDAGSWGMSFVGYENHPIFAGLETFENGKAYLLEGGTFRQNHTAWWFLPEWGGYGNGAGWRSQTGGTNLASESWDNALDGRVTIAEFSGSGNDKNVVVISMGAYDWYNEDNAQGTPSQPNGFIGNIRLLTMNSINYLAEN